MKGVSRLCRSLAAVLEQTKEQNNIDGYAEENIPPKALYIEGRVSG
jgi:hypothetical protein